MRNFSAFTKSAIFLTNRTACYIYNSKIFYQQTTKILYVFANYSCNCSPAWTNPASLYINVHSGLTHDQSNPPPPPASAPCSKWATVGTKTEARICRGMCDIAISTIYRNKQRFFFSFSAINRDFSKFTRKQSFFSTLSTINRDILNYIPRLTSYIIQYIFYLEFSSCGSKQF